MLSKTMSAFPSHKGLGKRLLQMFSKTMSAFPFLLKNVNVLCSREFQNIVDHLCWGRKFSSSSHHVSELHVYWAWKYMMYMYLLHPCTGIKPLENFLPFLTAFNTGVTFGVGSPPLVLT